MGRMRLPRKRTRVYFQRISPSWPVTLDKSQLRFLSEEREVVHGRCQGRVQLNHPSLPSSISFQGPPLTRECPCAIHGRASIPLDMTR